MVCWIEHHETDEKDSMTNFRWILMGWLAVTAVASAAGNIVQNGSFESGITSWTPQSGSTAAATTARAQDGSSSLVINQISNPIKQVVTLEVGVDYDISVWIDASDLTGGNIVFDTIKYDSAGQGQHVISSANGGWTQYSGSFTATNTSLTLRMFAVNASFSGAVYFDNIIIEESPEEQPPTIIPDEYANWATANSVTGSRTDDLDGDGRNNLLEYALGGDPHNDVAGETDVLFTPGGNGFSYTHKQRNDATNLLYTLQMRTNLTEGTWDTLPTTPSTNSPGGTFDNITHSVSSTNAQSYVRLLLDGHRSLYTYSFGGLENMAVTNVVSLLEGLGYGGLALEGRGADDRVRANEFYAQSDLMGDDFVVPALFMSHRFDQYGFSDADHKAAIDLMEGKNGTLWVWVRDAVNDGSITEQMVEDFITGIFNYALTKGVKVILYPHYNTYYPTVEDAMPLVEQINHPDFGIAINLCHELMSDKGDVLAQTFALAQDRVAAIIVSGALNVIDEASVASRNASTILSLDDSEYDLRPYLQLIEQSGFTGPIGFINFNLADPADYLQRTMNEWEDLCEEVGLFEIK